jgi:hypothetical protein
MTITVAKHMVVAIVAAPIAALGPKSSPARRGADAP